MKRLQQFLLVAFVLLMLAACTTSPTPITGDTPAPGGTVSPTLPPETPTATSTPLPGRLILVTNTSPLEAEIHTVLETYTADQGWQLVSQPGLAASDLGEDVKIVLLLEPDSAQAALAESNPGIPFAAITSSNLPATANLSVLRLRPADELFVAGFVTTIIAPDWRSGALLPADSPLGEGAGDAFVNGGRYFCGRCAPAFAPVVLFPVTALLPSSSTVAEWQAAVDALQTNRLETLHLTPTAASPDLLSWLAGKDIILVGSQTPPADLSLRWAATVRADPAALLPALLADLSAGSAGTEVAVPITLADVNPELFSPGKQEWTQTVIQMLADGEINPLSVPAQ